MAFNFNPCPVCHKTDVMIVERGEACRDTLTNEMWFISSTEYYCQCRNENCIHDSEPSTTMEGAVKNWNHGEIPQWEKNFLRNTHTFKI